MDTILITGGNGLIGSVLQKKLLSKGYNVQVLSRKKNNNSTQFYWNIQDCFIDAKAIQQADFIIHLAGAGIADKRWTNKRKEELVSSRVDSTKLLLQKVKEYNPNLKGFIAASGIGFYGAITSKKIHSENEESETDFLATVCKLWENESLKFKKENIRTVVLRTGVVFSKNGGALEKIISPIKNGIGAALGSGNQYIPWIHIDDLCELYIEAIENKTYSGIYNAVTAEHITNKELTNKIALKLRKKIWFPPIPSFILKIIFGEMAIILLEGSRISNNKILKQGFQFKFSSIEKALNDLI